MRSTHAHHHQKDERDNLQGHVWDQTTTSHMVTVFPEYWQKLTGGTVSAERLVEKSFQFLLEREPNTSILGAFDLPKIQRYFPEYKEPVRIMLK